MPRHRSSPIRLVTLLFALLQLALPTLASVADARLERESESPRAAAHVESPGGSTCPRIHPADCALCQFVSAAGAAPPRPPAPAPAPALGAAPDGDLVPSAGYAVHPVALPRAPPSPC
jgi:hypothetical protein